MLISMIVATARGGVIGKDNALPWHLPADLKYFKSVTMGKPVVMGRKTFESIGRPLPGRQNIVLTRDTTWQATGVTVIHRVDDTASAVDDHDTGEIIIIGGAEIYRAFLPAAERIYVTEVALDVDGDAFFPQLDQSEWQEVSREEHPADSNQPAYSFVVYDRGRS